MYKMEGLILWLMVIASKVLVFWEAWRSNPQKDE